MISLFGVMGALAAVALGAAPALAADDSGTITWAVRPVDGPDGTPRAVVDQQLDPGTTYSDAFEVQNLSSQSVTFRLTAADGRYTDTGRFTMVPSGEASTDAGLWITLPSEVAVDAGATVTVPFSVAVPANAEPGDHAAGIAASISSASTPDASGSSVGLESRVGFRVGIRVTGALLPGAMITDVSTDYRLSWNPFQPGALVIDFTVANTGNARFTAGATASTQGQTVSYLASDGSTSQSLLPGETRHMQITISGVWPSFLVGSTIVVDPTVTTLDGQPVPTDPLSTDVMTVAMPWPQLLVLLGVLLIVGALVGDRLRTRRRLRRLLAQAREDGRRDALVSSDTPPSGTDSSVAEIHPPVGDAEVHQERSE